MITEAFPEYDPQLLMNNVRLAMVQQRLTFEALTERSGLDERTLRGIVRGRTCPQAKTIAKLADGLGVEPAQLFRKVSRLPHIVFDRATNRLVADVVNRHPEKVAGWSDGDYDELYSRSGVGGPLTESGIVAVMDAMNECRELQNLVATVYESDLAGILAEIVRMLHRRVTESVPIRAVG